MGTGNNNIYESLGFEPTQETYEDAAAKEAITEETIQEAVLETQQVHDLAKQSLDFLAGLTLPTVFKYFFPPVFLSVWDWLTSYAHKTRDFSQLVLGLPRGFGKTMLMKLFIFYCIIFTSKKFILVVCETQTKANNIIADVIDMLNEPNVRKVFGDWNIGVETDRQDLKKFGFRGRNIILMGAGADSGIRGITLKNERPDVMLFDDIQSRECADSELQSQNLERWMVGTAMKAKSPHGCLFIFVGNMYPTKHSILRKLKHNPNWIKFIAGGILADGTSLWEELQPIEQLLKEYENDCMMGKPEIFFSEVLNDENAAANNLISLDKLPDPPFDWDQVPTGNFIVIDPSTNKATSDNVAVGYFEAYEGLPVLRKLTNKRMSPGETIEVALTYALTHNCRLIAIEGVAYQSTLGYWMQFICNQRGIIGIEAVEIYPGGKSKNSRIMSMFKSYAAGELFIAPECRSEVHNEITQFNPLRTDNTDNILDILTYAPRVLQTFGEFIVSMQVIQQQEFDMIPVRSAEETSPI